MYVYTVRFSFFLCLLVSAGDVVLQNTSTLTLQLASTTYGAALVADEHLILGIISFQEIMHTHKKNF